MINKIRKILLVVALGLIATSAYFLYSKYKIAAAQVKLRMTGEGVNVVIENFKVTHENSGRTDWELIAKSAEINQARKLTVMKNVSVTLDLDNDKKYWISADAGTLQNETQEFALEGNVKFVTQAEAFLDKFKKPNDQPLNK